MSEQRSGTQGGVEVEKSRGPQGFIITPIGDENSPQRLHAELVFNQIIEPALAAEGIKAYHGGQKPDPDEIIKTVVNSLRDDRVIICVLTGFNPNVFYELGIADSANRRVVLMIQKGEKPPFDISHRRVLEYDLFPRNAEGYRADLRKLVCEAIEAEGKNKHKGYPFNIEKLDALGNQYFKSKYYDYFRDIPFARISQIISEAERYVILVNPLEEIFARDMDRAALPDVPLGSAVAYNFLKEASKQTPEPKIIESLKKAASRLGSPKDEDDGRSVGVFVLLTDPHHPAIEHLFRDDRPEAILTYRRELEQAADRWMKLAGCTPIKLFTVKKKIITERAILTDKGSIVIPDFYSHKYSNECPAVEFRSDSRHHESLVREVEFCLQHNHKRLTKLDKAAVLADGALIEFSMEELLERIRAAKRLVFVANPWVTLRSAEGDSTDLGRKLLNSLLEVAEDGGKVRVALAPDSFDAASGVNAAQELEVWQENLGVRKDMEVVIDRYFAAFDHVLLTEGYAITWPPDWTAALDATRRCLVVPAGSEQYNSLLRRLEWVERAASSARIGEIKSASGGNAGAGSDAAQR